MDINKILKKILEIDDLVLQKHSHSNKSIIDKITQTLLDNWNAAFTHISDAVKHITSTERTNWNDANSKKHTHSNGSILDTINQTSLNTWGDKYTKNEVDNKINQVVSNMDWKESVPTYSDITKTYSSPIDGWTVNVKDTDVTYRYSGSTWIPISANSIPMATQTVDGKMSRADKAKLDGVETNANNYAHPSTHSATMITEDSNHKFTTDSEKANWNDANSKKHTHSNKSILDAITQAIVDNWNAAYTHISDTVKHITSAERTLWNTVANKLDKSGGNVKGKLLISEIDTFKEGTPNITLALGDNDTGFNSVKDGMTEYWSNNVKRYNMNDVYHTGNKPTPADIGASATGHTHTKAQITDMPTKVSQFINDSGFITAGDVDTSQNHVHANKIIIDGITAILIANWNSAYTHISDVVKHITATERTLWNTVGNKLDATANAVSASKLAIGRKINGVPFDGSADITITANPNAHTHDDRYYTETEINSKINTINSAIDSKANSSHDHNALVSIGRKTASDLPSTWTTGLYMTEVYNNGYPCTYGNCLTLKSSNSAITQICMEWKGADATIGSMWIRNKRDSGADAWSSWREFSFTNHTHTKAQITDFPTSLPANGGNSDTVDGFHASQVVGAANAVVVRDANGYINNTWFNSNRGSENTSASQYIYDSGDGYMRKKNLANVRAEMVTNPFGLGGLAIDISSQDCNNIVNTGFYRGSNCTNRCPGSHTWTYLLVMGHDTGSWISQIGINFNGDGTYSRTKTNGAWTAWRRLDATNTSQLKNDSGFITNSASISGNAATATKLQTARKINGTSFDGSNDITIYDSSKLPLAGGTVTGRTLFNQGISINNANGGAGTTGYMYLAQIKVSANYQNQPIVFKIHQRERFGTVIIKFDSQNTLDPTLTYINKIGNINVYIYKSATSTWNLYIQKSEGYDSIDIVGFSKGDYMNSTSVTWQSSTVVSLPIGYTEASRAAIDILATRATQDSDGKQINTTYVKKGALTWNNLKGV